MKVAIRLLFLITLCVPLLLSAQNNSGGEITKISKIVIDPGHGGRDSGCAYKGFLEKEINLSISLKLGELIKNNFPDVEVVYTRTTDKYIALAERSALANRIKADLFLSVHINANDSSAANGTSTYIMGVDNSAANLAVAMKENDVIVYEDDYATKYEGYVPGDPTSYIIFSLMQSANRDQSMRFAEIIQKHYAHDLPMKDFGARQASLLVLWKCSMPAVLTEVGFLSNERDRAYVTTNKGQSEAARSLFNAFSEYKSKAEGRSSVIILKERDAVSDPAGREPSAGAAGKEPERRPAVQAVSGERTTSQAASSAQAPKGDVKFYIQIMSLAKSGDVKGPEFKSYRGKVVEKKMPGGNYKYLVGGYAGYDDAVRQLSAVRREFPDAYVVAFEGNTQLNLAEARKRTK